MGGGIGVTSKIKDMLTNELPIYRDTFELTSLLIDYVGQFPKMHKHTIGQKMVNVSLELFEYLQLANRSADNRQQRIRMLEGFLVKFELLKVLIRLTGEKRIVSTKQLARLISFTDRIGRQATGWKNKN